VLAYVRVFASCTATNKGESKRNKKEKSACLRLFDPRRTKGGKKKGKKKGKKTGKKFDGMSRGFAYKILAYVCVCASCAASNQRGKKNGLKN